MTYAERSNDSLVEVFKSMNVEEVPSDNGDPVHEVLQFGLVTSTICVLDWFPSFDHPFELIGTAGISSETYAVFAGALILFLSRSLLLLFYFLKLLHDADCLSGRVNQFNPKD